ncbi:hypothetical protein SM793_11525 [Kitasatospora purpeofusca]|nr:hypothetical protein [Kitasatospora purpeofusca]MDY0812034.1 hypothetical protein [Kitasatospora purpeofusca]
MQDAAGPALRARPRHRLGGRLRHRTGHRPVRGVEVRRRGHHRGAARRAGPARRAGDGRGAGRVPERLPERVERAVELASIPDYLAGAGPVREALAEFDGQQPGGSAKAAKAIVDVIEAADPPLRLQLGADAVDQVEAELALVQGEFDTWQHVSLSTAV